MGGKTASISARLEPSLRDRLTAISDRYGPSDARMLEDALSALADFVEENGRYVAPLRIVAADLLPAVGEARASYGDSGVNDRAQETALAVELQRAIGELRTLIDAQKKPHSPGRRSRAS